MTNFAELGLCNPLLNALTDLGHTEPTPIQAQTIPSLLEGKDLMGIAQTGTGKTGAFALPVLHLLNATQVEGQKPHKSVRALVLAPTRELVSQICDSCRGYGNNTGLKITMVVGGVPIQRQIKQLQKGTDLLIATPGRLEDLMKQRAVDVSTVAHFILDEADQMMDMGFIPAIKRIASALPRKRQTLLFSATMPKEIEGLANKFLTDPLHVSVAPVGSTADRVEQFAYFVKRQDKADLLSSLLHNENVKKAIIFTRTKHGANRLVEQLAKAGHKAEAIHGNKNQNQRQRALNAFRNDECALLVATDVAARGIDIPHVSHVFNFDLPEVPDQYVHRIGRTARAGRSGEAIALISDAERKLLRSIQNLTKVDLNVLPLPDGFKEFIAAQRAANPVDVSRDADDQSRRRGNRRPQRRRTEEASEGRRRPNARRDYNRDDDRSENRRDDRGERRFEGRREDRNEGRREDRGEGRPQQSRDGTRRRSGGKPSGGRPGGRPPGNGGGNRSGQRRRQSARAD